MYEHLDAVVAVVCNVDAAVGRHCNATRALDRELPLTRALRPTSGRANFPNEPAIWVESLDEVVVNICNIYATVGCHRNVTRSLESTIAGARSSNLPNEIRWFHTDDRVKDPLVSKEGLFDYSIKAGLTGVS